MVGYTPPVSFADIPLTEGDKTAHRLAMTHYFGAWMRVKGAAPYGDLLFILLLFSLYSRFGVQN